MKRRFFEAVKAEHSTLKILDPEKEFKFVPACSTAVRFALKLFMQHFAKPRTENPQATLRKQISVKKHKFSGAPVTQPFKKKCSFFLLYSSGLRPLKSGQKGARNLSQKTPIFRRTPKNPFSGHDGLFSRSHGERHDDSTKHGQGTLVTCSSESSLKNVKLDVNLEKINNLKCQS